MKKRRLFRIDSEARAELPNGNLSVLMRSDDKKPSQAELAAFARRIAKRLVTEF